MSGSEAYGRPNWTPGYSPAYPIFDRAHARASLLRATRDGAPAWVLDRIRAADQPVYPKLTIEIVLACIVVKPR